MRRPRIVHRLRIRLRRVLFDFAVLSAAAAVMTVLNGPLETLPGFVCLVAWCMAGTDLMMIATDDNWMVSKLPRNGN